MHRQRIRATRSWRKGPARYDCILVAVDPDQPGLRGLGIGRVRLLFSFRHGFEQFPCALVQWYRKIGERPEPRTGMWMVEPHFYDDGSPVADVVHLDTVLRSVHLLPSFGADPVLRTVHSSQALDAFSAFYVSKYADHHSREVVF